MRSIAFLLFASACSLGRVDQVSCSDNDQCKVPFGWDSVCGDEGYCEPMEAPERCQTTYPDDLWINRSDYNDLVLIGGLYSLGYTTDINALRLPLVLNEDFSFDGHQFGMVLCDHRDFDSSELSGPYADRLLHAEAVSQYANWIADDLGVRFIVGLEDSDSAEIAIRANRDAGLDVLIVSPSATSVPLVNFDGDPTDENPGLFWRTIPNDNYQGEALAKYSQKNGVLDVGILFEDTAYGQGLTSVYTDTFKGLGGTTKAYQIDGDNVESVVSEALDGGHDGLLVVGAGELVTRFVAEVGRLEYPEVHARNLAIAANSDDDGTNDVDPLPPTPIADTRIFLTDIARNDNTLDTLAALEPEVRQALYEQIVGTSPSYGDTSVTDTFPRLYSEAYGGEPLDLTTNIYTSYDFDATFLMMSGMIWSYYSEGDITPFGVGSGIHRVSEGTSSPFNTNEWQSVLVEKFKQGKSVNVVGASGQLDYDSSTGETAGTLFVWTVADVLVSDQSTELVPGFVDVEQYSSLGEFSIVTQD